MHDLMERFYEKGIDALISHGALVDRFMGDQVVGHFVPGFAGIDHARQAVLCGLRILRDTGHARAEGPWVPVGIGVHTGVAFVGTVGRGREGEVELTAIGEPVNLAARLASVAGTGELVVSEVAAVASGSEETAERRTLTLKGIDQPVVARVLTLASEAAATP
jgi:adenylate cyclase